MWDEIGLRFVHALAQAATQHLGSEHAFVVACRALDLKDARMLLDRLDPEDAAAVLAAAHKQLREDDASVLEQWRPNRLPQN